MLVSPDKQCYKHLKYWLGTVLVKYFPQMALGPHSTVVPVHFRHVFKIVKEVLEEGEAVTLKDLEFCQAKMIYEEFTSSIIPPKVVFKYDDLPFDLIWKRLENPIMERPAQEIMFKIIHNIVPNRERFFSFGTHLVSHPWCLQHPWCHRRFLVAGPLLPNERRQSIVLGGLRESVLHQFTQCYRVRLLWGWLRGRILELHGPESLHHSDFEMLNFAFKEGPHDNAIVWMISSYCDYIYYRVISRNETPNLEKFIASLKYKHYESISENRPVIAYLPF